MISHARGVRMARWFFLFLFCFFYFAILVSQQLSLLFLRTQSFHLDLSIRFNYWAQSTQPHKTHSFHWLMEINNMIQYLLKKKRIENSKIVELVHEVFLIKNTHWLFPVYYFSIPFHFFTSFAAVWKASKNISLLTNRVLCTWLETGHIHSTPKWRSKELAVVRLPWRDI